MSSEGGRIDIERCWVEEVQIGFGMTMYLCWAREYAQPVGFVWGISSALKAGHNLFAVFGSYVIPQARRQGVRGRLNDEILREHKVITTDNGSPEGGEAFMRAYGYRFKEDEGTWVYVKPDPPPADAENKT